MTKKTYKGKGRKVSDTTFAGMPAVVYHIVYDEAVTASIGEAVKEVQRYHADGSVTVEGEVVKDEGGDGC